MGETISRVLQTAKSVLDRVSGLPFLGGDADEADASCGEVIVLQNCDAADTPMERSLAEIQIDFYQEDPETRQKAATEYALRIGAYPDEIFSADLDTYAEMAFDPDSGVSTAVIKGFKVMQGWMNSVLADPVARKLYPYLDQEEASQQVLGALYLAEIVGPNLSDVEASRIEFLTRHWLQDPHANIRSYAADVYAALPLKDFPSRERTFRLLAWLIVDPNVMVKRSALLAGFRLSENGISSSVAQILVATARSVFNHAYGFELRTVAAALYQRAFGALNPWEQKMEIAWVGEEFLNSIWTYKRLMGLQAFGAVDAVLSEAEADHRVAWLLPLLDDREESVRFFTANILGHFRPAFSDATDQKVQSTLAKAAEAEEDTRVLFSLVAAQNMPRTREEVELLQKSLPVEVLMVLEVQATTP